MILIIATLHHCSSTRSHKARCSHVMGSRELCSCGFSVFHPSSPLQLNTLKCQFPELSACTFCPACLLLSQQSDLQDLHQLHLTTEKEAKGRQQSEKVQICFTSQSSPMRFTAVCWKVGHQNTWKDLQLFSKRFNLSLSSVPHTSRLETSEHFGQLSH